MKIKAIVDEGFQDYKLPYMYIAMPQCSFKCCIEAGIPIETCQNCEISKQKDIQVEINDLVQRYISNSITKAVVIAGLEPFDTGRSVLEFIYSLREKSSDDIVVYTGYYEDEIPYYIDYLRQFKNIIVKFGRYIPNRPKKFDNVLGVTLASDNQYAERIS